MSASFRGHPLSSALPLGRGLFHRFGLIFCNLLRRLSLAYWQRSAFERATLRLSAQSANASYTRAQCFPLNTHPSRDKRSLTARGPVRGSPRRARSFGYCLSSRARSAVSRDIFCSAPPLGCGSVHVLGGSFARFCVSENVRVPLRYSGQPLHRKIIASRSPNTPWFCLSNCFFANFNQAIDCKSIYADSWQPKN